MSDPFGEENIEITEEFVEGDINEGDLVNESVEYIDENGISFNNNNNNSFDNNKNTNNTIDFSTEDVSSKNDSTSGNFSAGASHLSPKETAPAMKEYLAKHEKELEEKKKTSEEKRKKKIAEAKQSLDNFYSERESKKKTALKNNREHNKTLENENTGASGEHSWESVVGMIDLQAKPNANNKDTSRMKEILLRLKNQPIA